MFRRMAIQETDHVWNRFTASRVAPEKPYPNGLTLYLLWGKRHLWNIPRWLWNIPYTLPKNLTVRYSSLAFAYPRQRKTPVAVNFRGFRDIRKLTVLRIVKL